MTELVLREAGQADAERLCAVFNEAVASNATPEAEPRELTGQVEFMLACDVVLVAERGRDVLGYGFLKPFAPLASFAPACEAGVYLSAKSQRSGVGTALAAKLVDHARAMGRHTVLAKIDASNKGSVRLLQKCGFDEVARLKEIGWKNGRRVTVLYFQLMLGETGQ